jgi:uncharacterized protein YutD
VNFGCGYLVIGRSNAVDLSQLSRKKERKKSKLTRTPLTIVYEADEDGVDQHV